MKKSGVYKIVNTINGKMYVGSAIDIDKRWAQHRRYPKSLIGRALVKYSIENFSLEILELVENKENLLEREQYWIDSIQPFGKVGYNLCRTAGSTQGNPCLESTRKKIAQANKGRSLGHKSPRSKPTKFLSPEGKLVTFESIRMGSRDRGLNVAAMAEVARGLRRRYKGWTYPLSTWTSTPRTKKRKLKKSGWAKLLNKEETKGDS